MEPELHETEPNQNRTHSWWREKEGLVYCTVIGCTYYIYIIYIYIYISLHYIRLLCRTHKLGLVIGPVRSSTNSTQYRNIIYIMLRYISTPNTTPWGSIQPCCHHGAGNYWSTQTSLSNPFTPGSRRCTYTWSVLPKDTAPNAGSRDPYPRPLNPKSQAIVTAP